MGFPILVRWHLYIKSGPKPLSQPVLEYWLLIWTSGTNFHETLSEIHTFSFMKMHLKMLSVKWRPFCLSLNVLRLMRRQGANEFMLSTSMLIKALMPDVKTRGLWVYVIYINVDQSFDAWCEDQRPMGLCYLHQFGTKLWCLMWRPWANEFMLSTSMLIKALMPGVKTRGQWVYVIYINVDQSFDAWCEDQGPMILCYLHQCWSKLWCLMWRPGANEFMLSTSMLIKALMPDMKTRGQWVYVDVSCQIIPMPYAIKTDIQIQIISTCLILRFTKSPIQKCAQHLSPTHEPS